MIMAYSGAMIAAMALLAIPGGSDQLEPPVLVTADGQPIDVAHSGLAAPCYADVDGDGVKDLLVGEREGKLRIYRNHGTNGEPSFREYTWLKVGADLGRVPCG